MTMPSGSSSWRCWVMRTWPRFAPDPQVSARRSRVMTCHCLSVQSPANARHARKPWRRRRVRARACPMRGRRFATAIRLLVFANGMSRGRWRVEDGRWSTGSIRPLVEPHIRKRRPAFESLVSRFDSACWGWGIAAPPCEHRETHQCLAGLGPGRGRRYEPARQALDAERKGHGVYRACTLTYELRMGCSQGGKQRQEARRHVRGGGIRVRRSTGLHVLRPRPPRRRRAPADLPARAAARTIALAAPVHGPYAVPAISEQAARDDGLGGIATTSPLRFGSARVRSIGATIALR